MLLSSVGCSSTILLFWFMFEQHIWKAAKAYLARVFFPVYSALF